MRRSSLSPAKADLDEMDFGYATTIDDVFDAPVKQDDWTADDVEEGRPLLRVGSWSKDAPRSRRAKILACVTATVIFGPKASLFAGAAAVVTWSRHRAARVAEPVQAILGAAPTPAPTPAPVAMDPVGERR
jgi:hypothetical protein